MQLPWLRRTLDITNPQSLRYLSYCRVFFFQSKHSITFYVKIIFSIKISYNSTNNSFNLIIQNLPIVNILPNLFFITLIRSLSHPPFLLLPYLTIYIVTFLNNFNRMRLYLCLIHSILLHKT